MRQDERIHRYLGGELEDEELSTFEVQLAGSYELQEALRAAMDEDAVLSVAVQSELVPVRVRERWRRGVWAIPAAIAAVAASMLLTWKYRTADIDVEEHFRSVGRRYTEARVALPEADHFLPYDPLLAGDTRPITPPPLALLADLEKRHEFSMLAAAYLLAGHPDLALPYLDRAPDTADTLNDRAVAAYLTKDNDRALLLLERVLRRAPEHPQALWNRGLVLQAMGLPLAAAEAFDASARTSGPQWAAAARARAAALREKTSSWKHEWNEANEAAKRMVQTAEAISLEQARAFPGISRLHLYDALRSASSRQEVLRLEPVAGELDRESGSEVLRRLVRWTADRDFLTRAPLAQAYRRLASKQASREESDLLIAQARLLGEHDILIGAIYLAYREVELADEYAALAGGTGDPWFRALGQSVLAERAHQDGALDLELSVLNTALRDRGVAFRRLGLLDAGARAALALQRTTLAKQRLDEGLQLADNDHAWGHAVKLLQTQGWFEVRTNRFALAHAYFEEARLREPDRCDLQRYENALLGVAELSRNQRTAALRVITSNPACPVGTSQTEAFVLIDGIASGIPGSSTENLEAMLSRIEQGTLTPGGLVFQGALRGRFSIATGSVSEGLERLRQTVARARTLPSNANAQYGSHLAVAGIIDAEVRRGNFGRALLAFATEIGVDAPRTCALALSIDAGRFVALVRDAQGRLHHYYEPDVDALGPDEVVARVPIELLRSLEQCHEVDVMARSPLAGVVPPLPSQVAWRYLVPTTRSSKPPVSLERSVVVADVSLPSHLGLSELPTYELPDVLPQPSVLRGREATPSRALASIRDADEVEFYTHGRYAASAADTATLVLAEESDGRFALTPERLEHFRFSRAPTVMLTACSTTRGYGYRAWTRSLPLAFIEAGATAVIASSAPLPAHGGQAFFADVRRALRRGLSPAVAVRDVRMAHLERNPDAEWLRGVVVFAG